MIVFYVYVGSKKIDVAHTMSDGSEILWSHELFPKLERYSGLYNDSSVVSTEGHWSTNINDIVDFKAHFNRTYKVSVTLEAEVNHGSREDAVRELYDGLQIALDALDIDDEMEEE